jgi:hypothetical protein
VTATGGLDEETTGVDDDGTVDEAAAELDKDELELVADVLAVVEVVPGIVYALTAVSIPTPATAANAIPVVSRLSRRIAASRARTLD